MSLIDPETLSSFRELQGDDHTFIPNYFRAFLAGLEEHLIKLKKAVIDQSSQSLANSAHAIKSSSANTGVQSLSIICATLEASGKAGSLVGAEALVADVDRLVSELKLEIAALPEMKA